MAVDADGKIKHTKTLDEKLVERPSDSTLIIFMGPSNMG